MKIQNEPQLSPFFSRFVERRGGGRDGDVKPGKTTKTENGPPLLCKEGVYMTRLGRSAHVPQKYKATSTMPTGRSQSVFFFL